MKERGKRTIYANCNGGKTASGIFLDGEGRFQIVFNPIMGGEEMKRVPQGSYA